MATTIPDILVDSETWVDLYTVTGIPVGEALNIVNKSVTWCKLYEGNTIPDLSITDGDLISNYSNNYATANILAGSLKIWALSSQEGRTLKLQVKSVQ